MENTKTHELTVELATLLLGQVIDSASDDDDLSAELEQGLEEFEGPLEEKHVPTPEQLLENAEVRALVLNLLGQVTGFVAYAASQRDE